MLLQGALNLMNVLQMFHPSFVEDEDVKKDDHKILAIILINVVVALVDPKDMTNHSKIPHLDLKVIFHAPILLDWDLVVS